jgi:hypothetical protein
MSNEYVVGDSHAQSRHAKVETKPTTVLSEHYTGTVRHDTGGGYERVRSYESRPHTPTRGKESVYAYIHRLCAIAWLYPDDMSVGEILAHLDGRDVHHKTEVEWCNIGDSPNWSVPQLEVVGHGSHSRITQAEMRAFAADAKRDAQEDVSASESSGVCGVCGDSEGALATTASLEGVFCLSCVSERAGDGEAIEVL